MAEIESVREIESANLDDVMSETVKEVAIYTMLDGLAVSEAATGAVVDAGVI